MKRLLRIPHPHTCGLALLLVCAGVLALAVLPAAAAAGDLDAALPAATPEANPDAYQTWQETELCVPAPGVLANDLAPAFRAMASTITDQFAPVEMSLIATLPTAPANGSLTLREDGSLVYTPNSGFVGIDTFTYCAQVVFPLGFSTQGTVDGVSLPAIVSINVLPCVVDRPITKFIVSRRRAFEVYGFMSPWHPEGSYPVIVYCYRWERRRWVLRQAEAMRAYNFPRPTKYGAWIRLKRTGRWRLIAMHQNPGGTPTYSSGRILYVR